MLLTMTQNPEQIGAVMSVSEQQYLHLFVTIVRRHHLPLQMHVAVTCAVKIWQHVYVSLFAATTWCRSSAECHTQTLRGRHYCKKLQQ